MLPLVAMHYLRGVKVGSSPPGAVIKVASASPGASSDESGEEDDVRSEDSFASSKRSDDGSAGREERAALGSVGTACVAASLSCAAVESILSVAWSSARRSTACASKGAATVA